MSFVPEGLEIEPEAASVIFGDTLSTARLFTENLARHGEEYGLIGPLELPRLWSRHILNCAVVAPLLRPGRVGDVGSGAGLPGLVLAIARPDVEFTLIEPMERRVKWLSEQSAELELANVTVVRGRAEDVGFTGGLDQITARAVKAFSKLIPMCAPLVRPAGEFVFMKGIGAAAEIAAAAGQIRRFKLSGVEVQELGAGLLTDPTRVIVATVE